MITTSLKTLTNNIFVESMNNFDSNTSYLNFLRSLNDFVKYPESYNYNDNQKESLLNFIIKGEIFELYKIWINKVSPGIEFNETKFKKFILTYSYLINPILELIDNLVYIVEFENLEDQTLTKFIFVGENLTGFNSKNAATVNYRQNKKLGRFEATTVGRHKIKYFGKPHLMHMSDIGFDFNHEQIEFVF